MTLSPLSAEELAQIRERAEKATLGPWQWAVSLKSRRMCLEGMTRGIEYVLDFARWGMTGARMRLRNGTGSNAVMENADTFAAVVPGREHHAEWHQTLAHPDADFIAASRSDISRLLDTVAYWQEEAERLRKELEAVK